ncbi:helix-turn-helix domain-containing protein [Stenotrophomonas sp. 278]|nr:helix-turn-helix domain-containing protein [Stenotrophomonas sp. 278]
MQTLSELGSAVARRRKAMRRTQVEVAAQAGVSSDTLSRFERGKVSEFGARKLLAVLSILGMELEFKEERSAGNLDDLRKEHRTPRR